MKTLLYFVSGVATAVAIGAAVWGFVFIVSRIPSPFP